MLARWSVTRPIGTGILALVVFVLGLVAVRELSIDLLPSVDSPRITITTAYEGVAPEEIETLVTRPLEQAVSTIQGVDRLESTSAEGVSRIQLQFPWGANLDVALDDVRAQLDRAAQNLPEQADRPIVFKFDLSAASVATLAVVGAGDARRLRHLLDETLSRRLERVPGVARAEVRGGRVREIRVELAVERLQALGITAARVSQALAAENVSVAAGDVREAESEVVVRVEGEFESIAEIENTVIATRDGRIVRVRDVGEVRDAIQQVRDELWIDGVPGIRVRINKQSGANTVDVVRGIKAEVAAINRDYAGRLELVMLQDSAGFIESAVGSVASSAILGGLLAILVLWVFLRDIRSTLVIGISIPLSLMATFALMYFTGITLNLVSFGGLALGVGMLVDNSIVILENVYRRREEGMPPIEAAIEGAREMSGPVIAGTLTTLVVFVPVRFVGGSAGLFFGEMAVVVCFSLACSLVVALTLVPSLCAGVLSRGRGPAPGHKRSSWLERGYGRIVDGALAHPWRTVALSAGLLFAALTAVPAIGTELLPEADEGRLDVSLELPVGTPLAATADVVAELERRTRATVGEDELVHVLGTAGPEQWWKPAGSHQGTLEIMLVPRSARSRSLAEIQAALAQAYRGVPDAQIRVRPGTSNLLLRVLRGGSDDRLRVEVRGHDLTVAESLGAEVRAAMLRVEGIQEVRADRELGQLERTVRVDRARLGELGLGAADVARALEHYVLGFVPTRLRDDGDEFDIRVVLREEDRMRVDQLASLPIVTPDGREVALGSVARLVAGRGPSSIAREDQERVLKLSAGLGTRPLGNIAADLERELATVAVPEGFSLAVAGEIREQRAAFDRLLVGILLATFLVYATMAVQFESIRGPLVVMAALPFALVGAIAALVGTATTLNLQSVLGGVVLIGIVVNNAIVLVDSADNLRRSGIPIRTAAAAAATMRLRPIMMTTLTTVLALVPLAMALGDGSELQAPLARVVLGGLVMSTAVTLVLVPCLYVLAIGKRSDPPASR